MNKYFELDEKDLKNNIFERYKKDINYNKKLDIHYKLKILNQEKGTEKIIKLKDNKNTRKVTINIPKEIRNEQSILLIGEGRKQNNKYGNLVITFKIK